MKPHKNYFWTRVEEEKKKIEKQNKTKNPEINKVEMYTPKIRYFV